MSTKYNNNLLGLLGFNPYLHSIKTEAIAGLTTFLTMAYILAVNPAIFSALSSQGMDRFHLKITLNPFQHLLQL